MPPVNRLYQEWKARGLEVLLVNFRESPARVRRVVRERGYVAPVVVDERGDVTGLRFGVFGPPTTYVLDRQGRLLARGAGRHDWTTAAARKLIEDLLAQPAGR